MRHYLVSGFLTFFGGEQRQLAGTATLSDHELMDALTISQVQQQLLAEYNRTGAVAKEMRITSFQPMEVVDLADIYGSTHSRDEVMAELRSATVQLNDCAVIMPPVDSPLLIELAPGVLLKASRPSHVPSRDDLLMFDLDAGGMYIGRPRWTHP